MAYPETFLGQFSARGLLFEDCEGKEPTLAVVARKTLKIQRGGEEYAGAITFKNIEERQRFNILLQQQ